MKDRKNDHESVQDALQRLRLPFRYVLCGIVILVLETDSRNPGYLKCGSGNNMILSGAPVVMSGVGRTVMRVYETHFGDRDY